MSELYVVACDGSVTSQRALDYAVDQASSRGATLLLAHVLEWSPYSFLTPEELEERHQRRKEELERAQIALIDPLIESAIKRNVQATATIKYGHVAKTLAEIAGTQGAAQIFIGRAGDDSLTARVFGSVASTLAQIAPVPCTIVP